MFLFFGLKLAGDFKSSKAQTDYYLKNSWTTSRQRRPLSEIFRRACFVFKNRAFISISQWSIAHKQVSCLTDKLEDNVATAF
jgi:hypothetical protein